MGSAKLFQKLRVLLDENGYGETLPPDATPLVQHVLDDLIELKEKFADCQKKKDRFEERCKSAEVALKPYQEENGKIIKENNKLRMQNIKLTETNHKERKNLENELKNFSDENRDLKFLVEELSCSLKELEDGANEKNGTKYALRSVNQILENMPPTLPLSKNRLICSSCGREAGKGAAVAGSLSSSCDDISSVVDATQRKIILMKSELEARDRTLKDATIQVEHLKAMISTRESEIGRLQNLLEGGRSVKAILKDNELVVKESELNQLKLEMELVSKQKEQLQFKLDHVLGDNHVAFKHAAHMAESRDGLESELRHITNTLESELRHVTTTNKLLQKDCQQSSHNAQNLNVQLAANKEKLKDCHGDLVEQHTLYHETKHERDMLRNERDRLRGELAHLTHVHSVLSQDLTRVNGELCNLTHDHALLNKNMIETLKNSKELEAEKEQLEQILARSQSEKKTLMDKINNFTVKLQESDMERSQLKGETSALRSSVALLEKQQSENSATNATLSCELSKLTDRKRELELEKTFFRGEVAKSKEENELLRDEKEDLEKAINDLVEDKSCLEESYKCVNSDLEQFKNKLEALRHSEENLKETLSETEQNLNKIEKERDNYSNQIEQLLEILKIKPSNLQKSGSKSRPESAEVAAYERDVLKQERNYYKTQLQQYKDKLNNLNSLLKAGVGVRQNQRNDIPYKGSKMLGETQSSQEESQFPEMNIPLPQFAEQQAELKSKIIELNFQLQGVKIERDALDTKVNYLEKALLTSKSQNIPSSETALIPRPQKTLEVLEQDYRSKYKSSRSSRSPTSSVDSGGSRRTDGTKKSVEISTLKAELRAVETEKKFFEEQFEKMRRGYMSQAPTVEDTVDFEQINREVETLKNERNFYQNQYKQVNARISQSIAVISDKPRLAMQRQFDDILADKKELAVTKAEIEAKATILEQENSYLISQSNELQTKLNELNEKMNALEIDSIEKTPQTMQNFIASLKKSRDVAHEDVQRVKNEKEGLMNKVKTMYSQQIRDNSEHQEQIDALEIRNKELEAFGNDLEERLEAQGKVVEAMSEQVDTLQDALQQTQNELTSFTKQSNKYKKLYETKSDHAENQNEQLISTANKLSQNKARVVELETELSNVKGALNEVEARNEELIKNLAVFGSDKEFLNTELDGKAILISTLKADLKKRGQKIVSLEAEMANKISKIQTLEHDMELEKRRYDEETKRNERMIQDLSLVSQQKDAANKEIRRLQKEVVGLTQDLKELNAELEKTKLSRENFKKKAQEYCMTLESISEDFANKDKEQDGLMKQYLSLNSTLISLKSENEMLTQTLENNGQEMTQMEQALNNFKEEREQLVQQIADGLSRVKDLETTCTNLEQSKYELESELVATRDLSQKIESKRSEIEGEAKRSSSSLQKLLEDKRMLEREVESLRSQLSGDRSALRSLEQILGEKRKNEFMVETSLKQKEVENVHLNRKITELSNELESECSETKRLRTRLAGLELELERLKRDVTAEQYERERITQELRRVREREIERSVNGSEKTETVNESRKMRSVDENREPGISMRGSGGVERALISSRNLWEGSNFSGEVGNVESGWFRNSRENIGLREDVERRRKSDSGKSFDRILNESSSVSNVGLGGLNVVENNTSMDFNIATSGFGTEARGLKLSTSDRDVEDYKNKSEVEDLAKSVLRFLDRVNSETPNAGNSNCQNYQSTSGLNNDPKNSHHQGSRIVYKDSDNKSPEVSNFKSRNSRYKPPNLSEIKEIDHENSLNSNYSNTDFFSSRYPIDLDQTNSGKLSQNIEINTDNNFVGYPNAEKYFDKVLSPVRTYPTEDDFSSNFSDNVKEAANLSENASFLKSSSSKSNNSRIPRSEFDSLTESLSALNANSNKDNSNTLNKSNLNTNVLNRSYLNFDYSDKTRLKSKYSDKTKLDSKYSEKDNSKSSNSDFDLVPFSHESPFLLQSSSALEKSLFEASGTQRKINRQNQVLSENTPESAQSNQENTSKSIQSNLESMSKSIQSRQTSESAEKTSGHSSWSSSTQGRE